MIRWLKPPCSSKVAKYIECYWYLERDANNDNIERPKLNPDPAAHLILLPAEQSYHYERQNELNNKVSQGKGSHLLYPYCKTIELEHTKTFACIGIKFKVGALYSLQQLNFTPALLDTIQPINIKNILGATDINESQLLAQASSSADQCCAMLDELLTPWFAHCLEDKYSELTRRALPLLADTAINKLGEALFCSQRTLERSFLKVTGITLKQCQSMNRLEAILEYLYQRKQSDIDWVDIAYQFGFSDQPHLIRYLKKQIGLTPQDYAKQRGFTIDLYGGVVET
ncbi:helix-turn-helix domain-containing protein [Colwellia psychrerythraea]|uniref:Transcriptional regulator with only HTH domain, AraC family n=1 Tax=Colwellia psychrerythraea TaxID=28229 RepID=A0A099KM09_COLPS|nr:helix-turn-helix domain-containing protein [Colwellia psychrerythraea]KGJ90972.1 transcriptional regulator with only HTH domain, AraC family [Colwellia psychrerythraea]